MIARRVPDQITIADRITRLAPRETGVVIIGGGILGAAAAYYLSKAGKRVVLVEKGVIAGEQSGRNWGAVRQQRRAVPELRLMLEGNRLWRGLEQELGQSLDWRQQGLMRIAYEPRTLAWGEDWLPIARDHNLDTRMLTPREVGDLLPHFDWEACLGALYTGSDGCAEPEKAAPALARAAGRLGATVLENCAAFEIQTQNGAALGVDTEQGFIRAETVICAAGVWTERLLRPLRHRHPALWIRGTAVQTEPVGIEMRKLVAWGRSAYRQRPDGSLTLAAAEDGCHDIMMDSLRFGASFLSLAYRNRRLLRFRFGAPFWRSAWRGSGDYTARRALSPEPDERGLDRAAAAFAQEYPSAAPIRFRRRWAGYIDYMPDELPVIDQLAAPRGLFVAAGMHGDGFGMGPIIGKVLADLIVKGRSDHDLSAFRADRFTRAGAGAGRSRAASR